MWASVETSGTVTPAMSFSMIGTATWSSRGKRGKRSKGWQVPTGSSKEIRFQQTEVFMKI